MIYLYLILSLLGIWVGVTGWFFAYGLAKSIYDEHNEESPFPWYINVPIYTFLVLGLPLDFLWNVIFGSFIFRDKWYKPELPRELLFTSRVKRHLKEPTGLENAKRARTWQRILNTIDEGHV